MTHEEVAILWKDANGWDVRGYTNTLEDLGRFARLVAAKEREACAKVADNRLLLDASSKERDAYDLARKNIAADIRARGEQA